MLRNAGANNTPGNQQEHVFTNWHAKPSDQDQTENNQMGMNGMLTNISKNLFQTKPKKFFKNHCQKTTPKEHPFKLIALKFST